MVSMAVQSLARECAEKPFYDAESMYPTVVQLPSFQATHSPCVVPAARYSHMNSGAELRICFRGLCEHDGDDGGGTRRTHNRKHTQQNDAHRHHDSPARCSRVAHKSNDSINSDDDDAGETSMRYLSLIRTNKQAGSQHMALPHCRCCFQCLHHVGNRKLRSLCALQHHCCCCCCCHRCCFCSCCSPSLSCECTSDEERVVHVAKSRDHPCSLHRHHARCGTPQPKNGSAYSISSCNSGYRSSAIHHRDKSNNTHARSSKESPRTHMAALRTHCDAATQTSRMMGMCLSPARSQDDCQTHDSYKGSRSPNTASKVLASQSASMASHRVEAGGRCCCCSASHLAKRTSDKPATTASTETGTLAEAAAAPAVGACLTLPDVHMVDQAIRPSIACVIAHPETAPPNNSHTPHLDDVRDEDAWRVHRMGSCKLPAPREPLSNPAPSLSHLDDASGTHKMRSTLTEDSLAVIKEETLPAVRSLLHVNSALTSFADPHPLLSKPVHAPLYRAAKATTTTTTTTPKTNKNNRNNAPMRVLWDMRDDNMDNDKCYYSSKHRPNGNPWCRSNSNDAVQQSASVVHLSASRGLAATAAARTDTTVCADAFSTVVYDPYAALDANWYHSEYSNHDAVAEEASSSAARTVTADAFTSLSSTLSPLLSSNGSIVWPM